MPLGASEIYVLTSSAPLGSLSAEGSGVSGVLYVVTRNALCGDTSVGLYVT